MSEQTVKLMELIKNGKTCNEICTILGISNKQLFNNLTNLRNKGLYYRRKYYSNGIIVYRPITSVNELYKYNNSRESSIITEHSEEKLKCLVISDLHFGNSLERLDLLDRAYNYCIKENIHTILCCGDMIDGGFSKGKQTIEEIYYQIEHFVKKYPFDKNILTFGVGGDHDINGLHRGSQDIIEILKNYRHDIIITGYYKATINIKNDSIKLFHKIIEEVDSPIILYGHAHKYCTKISSENVLKVVVPSLSDINKSLPTAVELNLEFKRGYISSAYLKQIYFGQQDYVLGEINYDLLKNRNVEYGCINYEEVMRNEVLDLIDLPSDDTKEEESQKVKTLGGRKYAGMSQVEKFNKKYGL